MQPNANIDETRYVVWSISVLARDDILLNDFFLFQMTYLGYFMSEIKHGNFKNGWITCKWTSKRLEKMLQMIFVYIFAM